MKVTPITKLAREYDPYYRNKMRKQNPKQAKKTESKFVVAIGKLIDCYA
jgi:hypothetical protein